MATELRAKGVTRREQDVLTAVAGRLTNAEIATELHVSERTVESHVSSLLRKLGAPHRRALAAMASRMAAKAASSPSLPQVFGALLATGPLVGRDHELAALLQAWAAAAGGAGQVVVVSGEPGIGKSRLVAEVAARAQDDGGTVLLGAGLDGTGRPYEPIAGIVWDAFDGLPVATVRDRLGELGPVLARLAPEAAARWGIDAGPMVSDLDVERIRLFDAVARYLAGLGGTAPVLAVVEDIHWAGGDAMDLVRHLIHRVVDLPVLVVVTTRDVGPELGPFLSGVARAENGRRIELAGLRADALAALVRELGEAGGESNPSAAFLTRLEDATGGNPFFVRELLGTLSMTGEPGGAHPGPASVALPPSIRDVVADRLAHLSRSARHLVDAASVLGAEPGLPSLAATTGTSVDDALEALEGAERAGFVAPVPERPGRFAFRHALVRSAVYDLMPATRRLRLHRQAVAALSAAPEAGERAHELARHLDEVAVSGEAAVTLPARVGDAARQGLAFDHAALHFEKAVQAARRDPSVDPALVCDLTVKWGEALNHCRDPRYREVLLDAADLARAERDYERLAQVALALTPRGWVTNTGAPDPDSLRLAREALQGLSEMATALRARVLALLAAEVALLPEHDQRRPLTREALDVARRLDDDPATLGRVLIGHHWASVDPADLDERLAVADELVELGERVGDPMFELQGLVFRYGDLLESGDLVSADVALGKAVAEVDRLRVPFFEWLTVSMQAGRAMLAGRLSEGEQLANATLTVDVPAEVPTLFAYGALLITLRIDQGRQDELVGQVESLMVEQPEFPVLRAGLVHLLLETGRTSEARRHLDWFAQSGFRALPRNVQWLVGTALLANAAAAFEQADAAQVLYDQLAPFRGHNTWYGLGCIWPVDLALGQLATVLDNHETAEQHFVAAEDLALSMQAPVHLARARVHHAWAQRRAGGSHGEQAAAGLVAAAVGPARDCGAQGVLDQLERLGF